MMKTFLTGQRDGVVYSEYNDIQLDHAVFAIVFENGAGSAMMSLIICVEQCVIMTSRAKRDSLMGKGKCQYLACLERTGAA